MITLNSLEHIELMSQFERDMKPGRLDKEPRESWKTGIIYQDGNVNKLFLAYRMGCAYGAAAMRSKIDNQ